jgi:hypothetical protein
VGNFAKPSLSLNSTLIDALVNIIRAGRMYGSRCHSQSRPTGKTLSYDNARGHRTPLLLASSLIVGDDDCAADVIADLDVLPCRTVSARKLRLFTAQDVQFMVTGWLRDIYLDMMHGQNEWHEGHCDAAREDTSKSE